ncbi:MAG: hypothetical protein JNL74_11095, partial [Fibrobacteres bacterium]|nr:hypothetical protein [Fibrobacterota bacterium]
MEQKNTRRFLKSGLIVLVAIAMLLIPVGANAGLGSPGGVPGLILTTDILTNFSDFSSAYLNPALLTQLDQAEGTFGFKKWGPVTNPFYLSFAVPFGLDHTAAISAFRMGLSNVETTDDRGNFDNGYTSSADYILQGSYGYRLMPFLSVGGNVTSIYSTYSDQKSFGATFDVAARFHPVEDYLMGNISLGLNIQNAYYVATAADSLSNFPLNIHFQLNWWNEYYRTFLERIEFSTNLA